MSFENPPKEYMREESAAPTLRWQELTATEVEPLAHTTNMLRSRLEAALASGNIREITVASNTWRVFDDHTVQDWPANCQINRDFGGDPNEFGSSLRKVDWPYEPATVPSDIGARIHDLRTSLGIGQREAARLTGISQPTFSRLENTPDVKEWKPYRTYSALADLVLAAYDAGEFGSANTDSQS